MKKICLLTFVALMLTYCNEGLVPGDSALNKEAEKDGGRQESLIELSDLPEAIHEYVSVNYTAYIITEAELVTGQDGSVIEIEIQNGDDELDLIFDIAGLFLGLEEEEDDDDDDDDDDENENEEDGEHEGGDGNG